MDTNSTLFNESISTENDSNGPVPLYLTYLQIFMQPILTPLVTIPAVMVIRIILKNAMLKTRNNIFLVNLLIADVCFALFRWLFNTTLTISYLLGFNITTINCTIYLVPMFGLLMATKLMFVPLSVDRFVHIAFPFSYKKIMTTKVIAITISSLWLLSILVSTVSVVNQPTRYFPLLGACRLESTSPLFQFFLTGLMIISAVLITITSIYLRYRIIKSNKFFHSVKRSAAEEQKSIKAGRLVEILQEQIKPTLSVFIAGGIDGLMNMLFVIIIVISSSLIDSSIVSFYVIQFILIPIQLCQSLSHILSYGLYNKEIRKRLLDNYCSRKCCRSTRSKVVTLNNQIKPIVNDI